MKKLTVKREYVTFISGSVCLVYIYHYSNDDKHWRQLSWAGHKPFLVPFYALISALPFLSLKGFNSILPKNTPQPNSMCSLGPPPCPISNVNLPFRFVQKALIVSQSLWILPPAKCHSIYFTFSSKPQKPISISSTWHIVGILSVFLEWTVF